MALKMYRQGDILFVEAEEIPEEREHQPDGIVARGEVTGHMHRITPRSKAALYLCAAISYIHAQQETEIVHEEHDTINLPIGNYKVIRQQEYTPEGWRQVED